MFDLSQGKTNCFRYFSEMWVQSHLYRKILIILCTNILKDISLVIVMVVGYILMISKDAPFVGPQHPTHGICGGYRYNTDDLSVKKHTTHPIHVLHLIIDVTQNEKTENNTVNRYGI
uniref:Uncharacterized protein n=1 Tax=Cacopsylla melanoneura TaxID=428564 RepID=A0A8D9E212_9HEMI